MVSECASCGVLEDLSDDGHCVICYDRQLTTKQAYDRCWEAVNKDHRRAYRQTWYVDNRTRILAQQSDYRAVKRQEYIDGWIRDQRQGLVEAGRIAGVQGHLF